MKVLVIGHDTTVARLSAEMLQDAIRQGGMLIVVGEIPVIDDHPAIAERVRSIQRSRSRRNRTSGKRGGARPGAGRKSEAERKKHQRDAQRRSRERRAKLAKKRPPRKRKPAARKRVRTPKPKPMTASERGEVAAHMSKL